MDILKQLQVMESEYSRIENDAKQQLETVRSAMKLVREERLRTLRDLFGCETYVDVHSVLK